MIALLAALVPGPKPRRADPVEPGEVQVYRPPRAIRFTPRLRREVDATIDEFVRTAVLRRNLERSWRLAGPAMRAGVTRADWMRGDLPVLPYPADPDRTAWQLDYADVNEVALNVTLVARRGEPEPPQVFGVSLAPRPRGIGPRWLVSAWYPRDVVSQPQAPSGGEATVEPAPPRPDESEALRRASEGQIDRKWWLVPAGLLALIVLGPLGYFAAMRLRTALRH